MKTYAPDYYKDFQCIADRCRHSCCIGWDVYVDEDTAKLYQSMTDSFGKIISNNLCHTDDGFCFKMDDVRRCPFLDCNGLCNIIKEKGEGYLCEICREHPRFYNSFSDRWETGLGLSCEESARIILSQKGLTELEILYEDDEEEEILWDEESHILQKREELFKILQNRSLSFDDRVSVILDTCQIKFPEKSISEWAELFGRLERLNEEWSDMLGMLDRQGSDAVLSEFDREFEKLFLYFLYRHLSASSDKADFNARVLFSLLGCKVIKWLCNAEKSASGECSFEKLCEFSVIYSSEIEYSMENTEILIEFFSDFLEF